MSSGAADWKVLVELTHRQRGGERPPRVGDIIALTHGPTQVMARVKEILPPERAEAGTLLVGSPFTQ